MEEFLNKESNPRTSSVLPHESHQRLSLGFLPDNDADDALNEIQKMCSSSQEELSSLRKEVDELSVENRRLMTELQTAVNTRLTDGSVAGDNHQIYDDVVVDNLREQLHASQNEKESALKLWRSSTGEAERLRSELQKAKDNHSWKIVEERTNQVEGEYAKAVNRMEKDLKSALDELRSVKGQLSSANQKCSELQKDNETLKKTNSEHESERRDISDREKSLNDQVSKMRSEIYEKDNKLLSAQKTIEDFRDEHSFRDQRLTVGQREYGEVVDQVVKRQVRESVEFAENALLQRDQAIQMLKQKEEAYDMMERAVSKMINDEGERVRREVDLIKQRSNDRIEMLMNEIQTLETNLTEKDAKFDRLQREKRDLLSTLSQANRDGKEMNEVTKRKFEELSSRLIESERSREDSLTVVETFKSEKDLQDLNFRHRMKCLESEVHHLKEQLDKRDQEFHVLSEEKTKLHEEVEGLKHKLQTSLTERDDALRRRNKDVAIQEQEHTITLQNLKDQINSEESTHRQSLAELRKLLTAQQRMSNKWKEECRSLTCKLECRVDEQNQQICDVKRRNEELVDLLRESQCRSQDAEKTICDFRRKIGQLEECINQSQKSNKLRVRARVWATEKEGLLRSVNDTAHCSVNLGSSPHPVANSTGHYYPTIIDSVEYGPST